MNDFDWQTAYNKKALQVYKTILGKRRINHKGNLRELVLKRCKGKNVLDIGGAEHRASAEENKEQFMHYKLKQVCKRIIGIDIVPSAVKELNKAGYHFLLMDATSNKYIGAKFDVIHLGDVIEHVDNPVALLRFAKRHLKPKGEILVATPNPYLLSTIMCVLKQSTYIANMEHTCWITPSMANEIGRRAGLEMKEYIVSEPATQWKKNLLRLCPIEFKSSSFLYIYTK